MPAPSPLPIPHVLGNFDKQQAMDYVHDELNLDNLAPQLTAFTNAQSPSFIHQVTGGAQLERLVLDQKMVGTQAPMLLGLMVIHNQVKFEQVTGEALTEHGSLFMQTGLSPHEWQADLTRTVRYGCRPYFEVARHVSEHHRPERVGSKVMMLGLLDAYSIATRQIIMDSRASN